MIAATCLYFIASTIENKVDFSHPYVSGSKESYEFRAKSVGGNEEFSATSFFDFKVKDTTANGLNIEVTPSKLVMIQGDQVPREFGVSDTPNLFEISKTGIPLVLKPSGATALIQIPLVLLYLPQKELEIGNSDAFDFKLGESSYSGQLKYESHTTVEGKDFEVIKVKSSLDPGDGDVGEINYTANFDVASKAIISIDGTIDIGPMALKFTLKNVTKLEMLQK